MLLFISLTLTLAVSFIIYKNVEDLFNFSIRKRVESIVSTAALQFDPKTLDKIQDIDDVASAQYREVIFALQEIRMNNQDLKFIYIQRKTEDPNTLVFVADADSLNPNAKVDLNGDGIIDDEDALNFPGQEYDVSDYPEFVDIAFIKAYVDEELSVDQWGTHLSATAPIFSSNARESDYLIGIDVDVSDFVRVTKIALAPFILFIIFLSLLLVGLTVSLVKMWSVQVELLKELDRQKDELLGIVAHQLAKPITAIRWDLESFLDGDMGALNAQQKEETTTMKAQAVHLADLVSMILDVSRIQLGRIQLEPQPLELNTFFKEILDVIEPGVKDKKINFLKNMPANLPTVLLDKRYTRMTVENLLTNAVKYTPEGGTVTLNVDIKNDVMSFSVTDTGCGIPKGEQSKIFGKMYRASNVRNTAEGNGFGLYVAKGAVEGQGGKIWFTSTEGKGTTFAFELPMKKAA